jgi:hypothetical protein
MDGCMLGVLDTNTFVYSFGNGIQRSTDQGVTWTQVSTLQPRSKIPVLFKGAHYLCTSNGLIVSKDKGATWQRQGASIIMWQGPCFGADENTMVTVGQLGIYKTVNAGASWTRIAGLPPNVNSQTIDGSKVFDPKWFGCFSWDPINDVVYASRMVEPAFKCAVPIVAVNPEKSQKFHHDGFTNVALVNRSLVVKAQGNAKWELDLAGLDGARVGSYSGIGNRSIPYINGRLFENRFVIARLRSRGGETVSRLLVR